MWLVEHQKPDGDLASGDACKMRCHGLATVLAERAMLAALHGGCLAPIAALGCLAEDRLTLTGRVILRARTIALLIEGQDKLNTLAEALEDGPAEAMPIRTVLRGASDRLTIFAAQRA